jgi:polyisoprenoid-binding protein YceI
MSAPAFEYFLYHQKRVVTLNVYTINPTQQAMTTQAQTDLATYAIDASHSRVGFAVRHLGFSKVRGSFEKFDGTIQLDPEDLSTFRADATIDASTINTGDAKRDEHLRSGDFFEVETYPELTFKATNVKDVSGSSFTILGDLTMHGVTKTVELKGEFLGSGVDPWGNQKIAVEAKTTINRKDFGLNWNAALETGGVLVSEKVELQLDIQAALVTDDN